MALRKIMKEGYESLTKVCRPVDNFDKRLALLAKDLEDTVRDANGLGLAAPQVGVTRRVVVVVDEDENIITMVNPEIVEAEGEQIATEGCLSVPGIWGKTKRPAKVTVKAQDVKGNYFTITREGVTAVACCHEIDHLDGKLFRECVFEYIEDED